MKTVVGLFDNRSDADTVVRELIDFGVNGEDISMVASGDAERASLTDSSDRMVDRARTTETGDAAADGALAGAAVGGVGGVLLSLTALAIPGVGPVVAAGPLIAGLVGAGLGAAVGGLVGALAEVGVPEEQAGYLAEGVRRGGTLVSVVANDQQVTNIVNIMSRHNPVNVDERANTWRQAGWTGFDERANVNADVNADVNDPVFNRSATAGTRSETDASTLSSNGSRTSAATDGMSDTNGDRKRQSSKKPSI